MKQFAYLRASDIDSALQQAARGAAKFLGGGTNLVDLMRQDLEHPSALVDVTGLSRDIEELPDSGLRIGSAATNTALAEHPAVRRLYPMLTRAIVAGASGQIRNMATVAGNLLQRTRCAYFYDVRGARCNKRTPGQGCDAQDGFNRNHAVLGTSDACVSAHPSDMAVALVALDAVVHLRSAQGGRSLVLSDLYTLPGDHPEIETVLEAGELITHIEIPASPVAVVSTYRKVRDRASYAFALVSVAAALEVEDGNVKQVRIAFGGVAPKPWRAVQAEAFLIGKPATPQNFAAAVDAEMAPARMLEHNAFKPALLRATLAAVLSELMEAQP